MNVRIDKITPAGLAFDEMVEQSRVDELLEEAGTGYRALEGATAKARLSRAGERITVEGEISTRVQAPCKRCLLPLKIDLPVSFRLDLLPISAASASETGKGEEKFGEEGESEGSFDLEAADQEYYDGETIDLWPILREQLLLALPDYPLCQEACKGLCQSCGIDLNTGECACEKATSDPRWAALEKIKLT